MFAQVLTPMRINTDPNRCQHGQVPFSLYRGFLEAAGTFDTCTILVHLPRETSGAPRMITQRGGAHFGTKPKTSEQFHIGATLPADAGGIKSAPDDFKKPIVI